MAASASGWPLFHGRTSAIATGRSLAFASRTIARMSAAASGTDRPWAMSLMPPWITIASAPSAHASSRSAI